MKTKSFISDMLRRVRPAAALLLAAGAVLTSAGMNAHAAMPEVASAWDQTEQTAVRLISSTPATGASGNVRIGLHFKLEPGWKIYWRSPGDAGFPPIPMWEGSTNLADATMRWPAPERFSVIGLETLGYKKEVVFPIDVAVKSASEDLKLRLNLPYLVCDDVCIPYKANLSLDIPAGKFSPSANAHLIEKFDARVPRDGALHGLKIAQKAGFEIAEKDAHGRPVGRLHVVVGAEPGLKAPDLYIDGPRELGFLSYTKPEITLSDMGMTGVMTITVRGLDDVEGGIGERFEKLKLIATLVDGGRGAEQALDVVPLSEFDPDTALEAAGTAAPASGGGGGGEGGGTGSAGGGSSSSGAGPGGDTPFFAFVLFAVLGGLILNLMPCVLPVLSIKVLGVVGHGGGDTGQVRGSFLASAAGILAAFALLASALVGLKSAGMSIGWGIQFQQPWFLALMAAIVTLFACNLWGLFEINLPSSLSNLGGDAASGSGLTGHFMQGALATLLATPCSAPFVGTAVGFALARGTFEIYAIFAGLGIGLALPYLAIALYPKLATRLPKPGPWMVRLRQVMGVALAATAVWLVSVLVTSAGEQAAFVIGINLVVLVTVLFAGRTATNKAVVPTVAGVLTLVTVVSAEALSGAGNSDTRSADLAASFSEKSDVAWQTFQPDVIPDLVAEGKTVLVDVTADWCITCQVNKRLVLDTPTVTEALAGDNMVAMVADWTRPDDRIASYLASFDRYGIPFNVVYGPGAPDGVTLPELLTLDAVMTAFDQAGTQTSYASR